MTVMTHMPHELCHRDQWVAYRIESINGRTTKVPYNPRTGRKASATDPSTWVTAWENRDEYDGAGFVFTADDPYFGIDLDTCRDAETGVIEPWALAIVEAFATYTEPSPSGTGLHLIGRGIIPGDRNRTGKIEMYDRGRFFTMTGNPLDGYDQITDCQDALDVFYAATFPTPAPGSPRPASTLTMDDHALLAKARAARNGQKFDRLYSGDSGDHDDDNSAADLAFVSLLVFYTQDEAQLDRIVRQSGRYRPKWEREDYRRRTIEKALQRTEFYDPTPSPTSHGYRDMPPVAATAPERHTPEASGGCVLELARIAELEQALADEREKRIAAEQRNQTLMQTINNATWTPAQAIAYLRAQCEYDSKVERGDVPYGAWQDINLTELSKGVPKIDPDTGEQLYDADGTPKLQTSMTKKTISAALKTVAATAGVIELRDRTDERGRTRLQMRALRPTPLETMRAHAELFVQQDRARGRQKPKDPRLANIEPCPECGPDTDVIILADAYCGSCDQHLGSLPKERLPAPFQNETVSTPPGVVAVLPTDVKTKRASERRPKPWESNDFNAADIDPDFFADVAPVQIETVARSVPAFLPERIEGRCRVCRTAALLTSESIERGTCTRCCVSVRPPSQSVPIAAGGAD